MDATIAIISCEMWHASAGDPRDASNDSLTINLVDGSRLIHCSVSSFLSAELFESNEFFKIMPASFLHAGGCASVESTDDKDNKKLGRSCSCNCSRSPSASDRSSTF